MASLYGGATSSTLCTLGESAPPFVLGAFRRLGVSRLRRLFVLEYLPPISNSLSKEKTRRCRVQFGFFAPAIGTFSASSCGGSALLFRLLMQKNINAAAASTTTTTGTATAACTPGDDMALWFFCTFGVVFEALVATVVLAPVVWEPAIEFVAELGEPVTEAIDDC